MAPVVWGKSGPEFVREVLEGSLVNVIVQVLVTMEEWELVGSLKVVRERALNMEREADRVFKAGLEV